MAKTNSTFKFGKMNKIKLGNISDPIARNFFKKAMIDAQNTYMASKNRKFSDPAQAQKGGNRPQPTATQGTSE
jgi:hypothetical protein